MTDQPWTTDDENRDTEQLEEPAQPVDSMMKEPTDTDHPTGDQQAADNAENESLV